LDCTGKIADDLGAMKSTENLSKALKLGKACYLTRLSLQNKNSITNLKGNRNMSNTQMVMAIELTFEGTLCDEQAVTRASTAARIAMAAFKELDYYDIECDEGEYEQTITTRIELSEYLYITEDDLYSQLWKRVDVAATTAAAVTGASYLNPSFYVR
jgi:hypothetical protein